MFAGISGMKNSQTKLDVIGNNIANVNTYGFKKGRVTFKEALSQTISGANGASENRGGKNAAQVGLGATLGTIDTIHTSSTLQTTGRALDLGLDGDGYFVVRQGDSLSYTRAGNFYLDNNGTLVTGDGLNVQAFKYDNSGNLTTEYGDVTINVNAVLPAVQTTGIKLSENLSASATVGSVYSQQTKIIDETGSPISITMYFKKLGQDNWGVYVNQNPNADPEPSSTFDITFNAEGLPENLVENSTFEIPTSNGEDVQQISIDFDLSKLMQLQGATTAVVDPDGNTSGKLESYNISPTGEINGIYSNGEISLMGRLALAKFSNTAGLMQAGSNLFQESINSGTPDIGIPGNGRARLVPGALEMSNVDLSEEFTEMITAQRGFMANTRIITTSDEILQELVNLKR